MCFHVYSHEYICSACCHEFDTIHSGSELVWFHWYVSSRDFVLTHQISSQNPVNSRELSQPHEYPYRTREITGHCLLGQDPKDDVLQFADMSPNLRLYH